MKFLTQKRPFFCDSAVTESTKHPIFGSLLKYFFLLVMLNPVSDIDASVLAETLQNQTPLKAKLTPKSSPIATKVNKNKIKSRLIKSKRKKVIKKDTLQEIDPANASSPLYQNNQ